MVFTAGSGKRSAAKNAPCNAPHPAPKSMLRKYASAGYQKGLAPNPARGQDRCGREEGGEGRGPATPRLAIIYVYVVRSLDQRRRGRKRGRGRGRRRPRQQLTSRLAANL